MSEDAGSPGTPRPRPRLLQHAMRREWGRAVYAWKRDGRRTYLFEDGELRTFRGDFARLFEPVPMRSHAARQLARELRQQVERVLARQASEEQALRRNVELAMTDQLELFRQEYPSGFRDHRWLARVRGEGQRRRLKRHRAPAIAAARLQLSRRLLDHLHFDRRWSDICEAAVQVLIRTDLAPLRELRRLRQLEPACREPVARAIHDLLFADDPFEDRFDGFLSAWLAATSEPPSWPLATALGGLVHRHEHVCVHLPTFELQAKIIGPSADRDPRPSAERYRRWQTVAEGVRQVCAAQRCHPQDLLDVHDFIQATLSPRAREQLEELRRRRLEHSAAAPSARDDPNARRTRGKTKAA